MCQSDFSEWCLWVMVAMRIVDSTVNWPKASLWWLKCEFKCLGSVPKDNSDRWYHPRPHIRHFFSTNVLFRFNFSPHKSAFIVAKSPKNSQFFPKISQNIPTCPFFLHKYNLWYLWQIWALYHPSWWLKTKSSIVPKSIFWRTKFWRDYLGAPKLLYKLSAQNICGCHPEKICEKAK